MIRKTISIISRLTVILVSAGVLASAQTQTCTTKLDQLPSSPELRGFNLGMTIEQVKVHVPPVQIGRADQFGVTKTSINPDFDPRFDKANFAGVRTISLDFLDGKLVTLWIGYNDLFKWQKLDDFIPGMATSLNLPVAWLPKRNGQELRCDGFSVFASLIAGSPSLRLTDEAAQETIAVRREEAAAAEEAVVLGDRSTRLYYPSDCAARDNIPDARRVVFKDKDEAEKAGYKLAKDCQ